jgi:hypothetical protein
MEVKTCDFDEEFIEKYNIGSGILPVAIDQDNNVVILCAKERYVHNWKGSNKWSGFEGSRQGAESVIDTALRELNEEGLGLVRFHRAIRDILQEKLFVMKVVINIYQEQPSHKYHTTFVVQTDYDPTLPARFHDLKILLNELHNESQHLEYLKHDSTVPVATVDLQRRKVTTLLRSLPECDAVSVQTDSYGAVAKVRVNGDYLEKDSLRWWSLDELELVIQNKGNINSEYFRSYFMPVLQTVVTTLQREISVCTECE